MNLLYTRPVVSGNLVALHLGYAPKNAYALIRDFERLGILVEITGYRRNRIFVFHEYLNCFDKLHADHPESK